MLEIKKGQTFLSGMFACMIFFRRKATSTDYFFSEVGIHKRKQESKKTRTRPRARSRKQELDQESDQENKKTRTRPRKRPRKKEKTFFFS